MNDGRKGSGSGWQPLSKPNLTRPELSSGAVGVAGQPADIRDPGERRPGEAPGSVSSFVRLARTHAFHAAGDAVVLVALAGTFFALDANGARSKILLYLVLTMTPFALVGPLIGPALDRMRGGRRLMIILTMLARALLMILMIRNIDTVWLFPIAFAQLVLGKTYSVAKAATVPTTVSNDDELVDKNSRLAVLTAVAGGIGAAPALGFQALFGTTVTLSYAAIIYIGGMIAALQMPRALVDNPDLTDDDEVDIRSAGVQLASWATAVIRSIVGFVLFLLIFEFGRADQPDLSGLGTAVGAAVKDALGFDLVEDPGPPRWKVAIPFAFWSLGMFVGNLIAPRARKRFTEENMILGALVAVALAAVAAVWTGGISGAALLAVFVGTTASAAKLAFDSLVQRDAPGANHGAAFGRFETRFQIAWVVGALLAVIIPFPLRAGFLVVALAAAAVAVAVVRQGTGRGLSFGRSASPPRPPRKRRRRQARADEPPPADGAGQPDHRVPAHAATAPAPTPAAHAGAAVSDPYADAFAEVPIEPPDWAAAVFGADGAAVEQEPQPTPPMGTPRITPGSDT